MRRRAAPVLLLLCLGSSVHASRMVTPPWRAYDQAELVLEVQVTDEWSPKQSEEGKRRGIEASFPGAGAFYRVSVKSLFKLPHWSVKELVVYVEDAHVLSTGMGPQLEVGRTYIVFLKRAKIGYFVSRFYDIPAGPVWSQIENYEFDPKSEKSVKTREALLAIFRYKKLTSDDDRKGALRDILRTSDSRMLLNFAIGEAWRRHFEVKDALREAGERLLDRDVGLAVDALHACKRLGGAVSSRVLGELFRGGYEKTPSTAVYLVEEADIDAVKHVMTWMLKPRRCAKYNAAIKKLAELRPSYLEKAIDNEEIRAFVYYLAVRELRKRGHEFKLPLRFEPVLDLPHNLALAICEAYEGRMFHLKCAVESWRQDYTFAQWAKGLRLIEFRLNDPDERRASAVVSAFRSRGIELKLVDGKYHPVSYERSVGPPVALEIKLPSREFRVGEPVPIELVESATRPGERMCLSGEWRVRVWGPRRSVGVRVDDKGDGEEEYVRLVAGDQRTKVTSHTFENPGRHTISAFNVYRYDDRKDGGAWTGATEPVTVEIVVKE